MQYYSGFSLAHESTLFNRYLIADDFTIAGFSYGAIKAFEEVYKTTKRIDRLQLFSPAFFQYENDQFKRLQLLSYKKDQQRYRDHFVRNITYPKKVNISGYLIEGTYHELHELMHYVWDQDKLAKLVERGVDIEVYLGEKDKIINSMAARDFFQPYATVYFIKEVGHIL
jgi:hypothetical protein